MSHKVELTSWDVYIFNISILFKKTTNLLCADALWKAANKKSRLTSTSFFFLWDYG